MFIKKVLQHLTLDDSNDIQVSNRFRTYEIDTRIVLQNKIGNLHHIPLILTKDNQLIFVIKNTNAIEVMFKELIDVRMGLFYFEVAFIDNTSNPLQKNEHVNRAKNVFFYLLSMNVTKLATGLCLCIG